MSYENFCESSVGTVKELVITNGHLRFAKVSEHKWLVEFSMINSSSFPYSIFTTCLTQIEASTLFDTYSE